VVSDYTDVEMPSRGWHECDCAIPQPVVPESESFAVVAPKHQTKVTGSVGHWGCTCSCGWSMGTFATWDEAVERNRQHAGGSRV
jgi:hypothetical protein